MVGRTEKALHSLGKLQLQEAIVRHGHPDIAANTIGKVLSRSSDSIGIFWF